MHVCTRFAWTFCVGGSGVRVCVRFACGLRVVWMRGVCGVCEVRVPILSGNCGVRSARPTHTRTPGLRFRVVGRVVSSVESKLTLTFTLTITVRVRNRKNVARQNVACHVPG